MNINVFLLFAFTFGLFYNYKRTLLWMALLWPVIDMLSGLGPISFTKVLGLVAFIVAIMFRFWEVKRGPFFILFLPIIIISVISNYINERHTPSMLGFASTNIFLPFIFWSSVKLKKDVKLFLKIWTIFFVIVCLYGYIEAILNSNPFAQWACDSNNKLLRGYYGAYSNSLRYGVKRIQSLMICRDSCGALSAFFWGLLYYFKEYKQEYIDSRWMKFATTALMFMLPITVLLTGTRACIAILAVCMLGTVKKINPNYVVLVCMVGMIAYFTADLYLNNIIQSFVETDTVSGSSIDMRQQQLYAVYFTLRQSPLFGNGFGSWNDYSKYADDLLGAESLWFQLLLKIGILGTVSFILIIVALLWYIYKTHTPYAMVLLTAFLVGLTLSSLPGFDLPLLFMFVGMMVHLNKNVIYKTYKNDIRKKLVSIRLRSSLQG